MIEVADFRVFYLKAIGSGVRSFRGTEERQARDPVTAASVKPCLLKKEDLSNVLECKANS